MVKNIKAIVYDIISTDEEVLSILWDANQIHYQNDDPDENRAKATFDAWNPIITFYRISEKAADYPKRTSLFQITCWSKDNKKSENLKNAVIECLHRRKNMDTLSYVELTDVWRDMYDKELKVWGIPLTFIFIYKDTDF